MRHQTALSMYLKCCVVFSGLKHDNWDKNKTFNVWQKILSIDFNLINSRKILNIN